MQRRRAYLRAMLTGAAGVMAGCNGLGGSQTSTQNGASVTPTRRTTIETLASTKLGANDGDPDDRFGSEVALDGDRALIGAPRDEDPHGTEAGSAYVFEQRDGSWEQTAKLVPDDGASDSRFGSSLALSGDTALVGALFEDDPDARLAGSVYVFEQLGGSWEQTAKLSPEGGWQVTGSEAHSPSWKIPHSSAHRK